MNHSCVPCSSCTRCSRSRSPSPVVGSYGGGSRGGRSGYTRSEQHAPARAPPVVVHPAPQRSMFRDAAAIAGGVTVGTTVGHLAGEAISSLFGGGRRTQEVQQALPRDYDYNAPPAGPCAYEIAQFLNCASQSENLEECQQFNAALRECKKRNRLP